MIFIECTSIVTVTKYLIKKPEIMWADPQEPSKC